MGGLVYGALARDFLGAHSSGVSNLPVIGVVETLLVRFCGVLFSVI